MYSDIFQKRDPLYRETADIIFFSNDFANASDVAREIQSRLSASCLDAE